MPVKMLVVDDEPDLESLIRQRFRKQIRDSEYEFIFAHNGVEALAQLEAHTDVTLILSDINMPEMDGLTLLTKLNDLNNPVLKSVIISAYGDMDNIRTAMNRGAFDFITKPIDFNDLDVTINKTLKQLHIIRQAVEDHEQLISVKRDLSIAARIQQSLLPRVFPPFPGRKEFDIYAEMHPAKDVGGDFFDFFFIDDVHLGVVVGDVSGKGIPAAIFMALTRTVLKTIAARVTDPGQLLQQVNLMLIPESDETMFVTIFYAVLNTQTGEITYSSGGHNSPFLLQKDSTVKMLEFAGGGIVGKIPGLDYGARTFTLQPGETLYLYTDGVTEAMNREGVFFEESRLVDSLGRASSLPLVDMMRSIDADLKGFINGAPQSDDITMLTLRYLGNNK